MNIVCVPLYRAQRKLFRALDMRYGIRRSKAKRSLLDRDR